jgi:hypothetical protein
MGLDCKPSSFRHVTRVSPRNGFSVFSPFPALSAGSCPLALSGSGKPLTQGCPLNPSHLRWGCGMDYCGAPEALGGRLPGRADGSPSGPPTDPYVRHARLRCLKQRRGCPCKETLAPPSTGLPWSGCVRSPSLPGLPPADALPDGACPPVGRLGLTSPPSPVLCAATTATVSLSGRFAGRSLPDTVPASIVCGVPSGLVARRKRQVTPGPVVTRSPHSGSVVTETDGAPTFPSSPSACMPRSQTPVVSCILALPHPGLLPSGHWTPSAFPSLHL